MHSTLAFRLFAFVLSVTAVAGRCERFCANPQQCLANPCDSARCPAAPYAQCVPSYCGGCNYDFYLVWWYDFLGTVVEACSSCQEETPELQPVQSNYGDAPFCEQTCDSQVQCLVDPCKTATCDYPDVTCESSSCGGCNYDFYSRKEGVYIRECSSCR